MIQRPALGVILLTFVIITVSPSVQAQQAYTPNELILTVYSDGIVRVEYQVKIDVTYPSVEIPLFGAVYEDLIVEDQDGIPLDYTTVEMGIRVYTLGASSTRVTYFTSDLTSKSGRIWVLTFDSPVNSTIILPEEATIISLNRVPMVVGIIDGRSLLTMSEGEQEISYIVGVVGTREHALVLVKEAEVKIQEIKAGDIIVSDAEAKLREAKDALDLGRNAEAERLAKEAKELAIQTEAGAIQAKARISESESSINKARREGRITSLNEAEDTLGLAKYRYNEGDYGKALELADQAKAKAESATTLPTTEEVSHLWIPVIATIAILIALLIFGFVRKSKVEEKVIDVEEIFEKNPQIRYDDREVIRFLAERGGEALETEIREKFELPRTTSWRLVRRLQREGIVELGKVGGRNLIRIKAEYVSSKSKTG